MRAGALDKRILIRKDAGIPVPDEYGVTYNLTDAGIPMRAKLVEATSEDSAHESGHITKTMLTFRLRYLRGVQPGDRLDYEDRTFEITGVKEIGRRKGLELTARNI